MFPNTPADDIWTGETAAPDAAYIVYFGGGGIGIAHKTYGGGGVRLVRGGQYFDPLAPTAQTLAFNTPLPTLTLGSSPTITATSNNGGANSGNPIRYSSATPLVCGVDTSTGQITLTNTAAAGNTCTVNADQYGRINNSVNYAPAAQIAQSLTVAKASQSVNFTSTAPTSAVVGGASYSVSAAATSNLDVALSIASASSSNCAVTGGTVSFTGAGSCKVLADQSGDGSYTAAPQVFQSFTVGQGRQSLTWTTLPTLTFGDSTKSLTATASSPNSSNSIVYSTPDVSPNCSVNASTGVIATLASGTCTLNANLAGNGNYTAAQQITQSLSIG